MEKKTKSAATSARRKTRPREKGAGMTELAAIDSVATLKELRKATDYTQDDLALAMDVGQGTISRIEKRDDMLVSTLQHYVESLGGSLQLLVSFPDGSALRVERLGKKTATLPKGLRRKLTDADLRSTTD